MCNDESRHLIECVGVDVFDSHRSFYLLTHLIICFPSIRGNIVIVRPYAVEAKIWRCIQLII